MATQKDLMVMSVLGVALHILPPQSWKELDRKIGTGWFPAEASLNAQSAFDGLITKIRSRAVAEDGGDPLSDSCDNKSLLEAVALLSERRAEDARRQISRA